MVSGQWDPPFPCTPPHALHTLARHIPCTVVLDDDASDSTTFILCDGARRAGRGLWAAGAVHAVGGTEGAKDAGIGQQGAGAGQDRFHV